MILRFSLVRVTPSCCLMFTKHADLFSNHQSVVIPSFYKPQFLTQDNLNFLLHQSKLSQHNSHFARMHIGYKSYEEYCNLGTFLDQSADYRFKFASGAQESFAIYRLPSFVEAPVYC